MTGPAPLLAPIIKAHQFLVFTVPSNLQRAVAAGLKHEQGFYRYAAQMLWHAAQCTTFIGCQLHSMHEYWPVLHLRGGPQISTMCSSGLQAARSPAVSKEGTLGGAPDQIRLPGTSRPRGLLLGRSAATASNGR